MARSNDIQYVRYYNAGSEARKLELPEKKKVQPKPSVKQAARPMIRMDGLSVVGTIVAAVMLLCMVVGFVRICDTNRQVQQLEAYVSRLEVENKDLRTQYAHGYDLEQIRIAAQSMGLVPEEQVRHITVSVAQPAAQIQTTWWQELWENVKAFFA